VVNESGVAMPSQLRNHKYLLLAVATVLLTLLMSIATKEGSKIDPAEGLLRDLLAPVQKTILSCSYKIGSTIDYITTIKRLGEENAYLSAEIARLKAEQNLAIETREENVRLRKLLNLPPAMEIFRFVAARVVARDSSNWYNTLIIDQGCQAKVEADSVVITNDGVVGRVQKVSARTAEVLLISDQRSAVGAMGQSSRDVGVLRGGDEEGYCRLVYLPRTASVQVGEIIITSGLGGNFPKGLVLGQVMEVQAEDYGLGKFARVKPTVDLDHLEEVLVILESQS
jgi:rod shape-determining protein MreC